MKYGQGFWVVNAGVRVKSRDFAYPDLKPFEYADGTGDRGWLLLSPFTFDYVKPGDTSGLAWRFTVEGDPDPVQYINSYDYDGASVPPALRAVTRDKMDHRWVVAALGHDLGYCIHGYRTGFSRADWDEFLKEVGEAYGDNPLQCAKYWAAVRIGGGSRWPKTPEETERYQRMVRIQRVPL